MHKIYSAATTIQVWLGEEDEETDRAFSTLQRLADERNAYGVQSVYPIRIEKLADGKENDKRRRLWHDEQAGSAIYSIINRDYFERRWCVQEYALAREIVINCGKHTIAWETFGEAYAVIRNLGPGDEDATWMPRVKSHKAWSIIAMRYRHQNRTTGRDGWRPDQMLMYILHAHETALCRNEHDLIYALLGLAEDDFLANKKFRRFLEPQYAEKVDMIFQRLAFAYLFGAQDPRILHHVRNHKTMAFSFVPDWRVPSTTVQFGGDRGGGFPYNAGIGFQLLDCQNKIVPLSFAPDLFRKSATFELRMNDTGGIYHNSESGSMRKFAEVEFKKGMPVLLGWYVDEIHTVGHTKFKGDWKESVFASACYQIAAWHSQYETFRSTHRTEYGGSTYGFSGEDFETAFARLMVGDNRLDATRRQLGVDMTTGDIRSSCDDLITLLKKDGVYAAAAAWREGEIDVKVIAELTGAAKAGANCREQQIVNYLYAATLVINNRAFIRGNDEWIGLGPLDSRNGDVIAVIAGAETPFVLRPVTHHGTLYETGKDALIAQIMDADVAESAKKKPDAEDPWVKLPRGGGGGGILLPIPDERAQVYTVVGECYIHGIMDGEFMVFDERRRKFELR